TRESADELDLSSAEAGRPERVFAAAGTDLTVATSAVTPWIASDDLSVAMLDQGLTALRQRVACENCDVAPPAGATAIDARIPLGLTIVLSDTVRLLHYTDATVDARTVRRLVQQGVVDHVAVPEGHATASAALADVALDRSATFDLRAAEFDAAL